MDNPLDLAKMLYQLPLPVLLLAALIWREIRCDRRETAWDVREKELLQEIDDLHTRSEERDAQFSNLLREAVVSLTRVADVLR